MAGGLEVVEIGIANAAIFIVAQARTAVAVAVIEILDVVITVAIADFHTAITVAAFPTTISLIVVAVAVALDDWTLAIRTPL